MRIGGVDDGVELACTSTAKALAERGYTPELVLLYCRLHNVRCCCLKNLVYRSVIQVIRAYSDGISSGTPTFRGKKGKNSLIPST